MGRPQRFPNQFRRDALKLVGSSGRPIADVARSLTWAPSSLSGQVASVCRCRQVWAIWAGVR
jgi:transposase-like protein